MKQRKSVFAFMTFCLFLMAGILVAADGYAFGVVPNWVELVDKDDYDFHQASDSSYGYSVSIIDFQADITGVQQVFRHTCVRIDNSEGLQNMGQLNFDFDPSFESLTINFINVYREGRQIEQIQRAKFNLLTRESEMEYLMYDGSKSLNIILSDLRIGDELEYAYTVSGSNPVFNGEYYLQRSLQYGMPISFLRVGLRTQTTRNIGFLIKTSEVNSKVNEQSAKKIEHKKEKLGNITKYQWLVKDAQAKIFEDDVPDWENTIPVLQISTMTDWDRIRLWAYNLFAPYSVPSSALTEFVHTLVAGLTNKDDQVDEIVKFVQRDVRYLGLEFGAHAYKPHQPDETLNNRFGDCKDKALLLQVMLKVLGVESKPVLVDTYKKRFLSEQLPGVIDFNHVVLVVNYDGKEIWIDATNSNQVGSFKNYAGLEFAKGLPVSGEPSLIGLITIPEPVFQQVQTAALETFTLPVQWDGEGTFEVSCTYYDDHAENMRSYVKSASNAEIEKQYLEYYGHLFPSIKQKAGIKIEDSSSGVISSVENYTIPKIWDAEKESDKGNFSYYPMMVTDYLKKSAIITRTDPFALTWPLKFQETVKYVLPAFDWKIKPETYKKENAYFAFSMEVKVDDSVVIIDYLFETKTDYVPADKMEEFNKDIDEVYDNYEYMFFPELKKLASYVPRRSASGDNGWGYVLFVLIAAVLAAGYKFRNTIPGKIKSLLSSNKTGKKE